MKINNVISDNHKDIASHCAHFYKTLYDSKYCSESAYSFLDSLRSSIKTIVPEDRIFCDAPITLEEVVASISNLKNNKSPGVDGLSAEFYKEFSEHLAPFLLKMFSESIINETLPPTLSQGLLTLIPKPRKDLLLIDNWRPICLLNNDYKLLASLLANRLKKTLTYIIDEAQSGFLKNRHISDNVRLVLDLLDY